MLRHSPRPKTSVLMLTVLAAAGIALMGCNNNTTGFARVEEITETVARFERLNLEGRQRVEYQVTVGTQTHPEVMINWTNLNREIEVEVYVVLLAKYDPNVNPATLKHFWSSVPEVGPNFGDRRPTLINLHPEVGTYVVVFYNPNDRSPSTRATLSATIEYSYYAQQ